MISGELWGKDQGWESFYKGRNSSAARRDGFGIWLCRRATTTMHLA